jgi:hypothetical protein
VDAQLPAATEDQLPIARYLMFGFKVCYTIAINQNLPDGDIIADVGFSPTEFDKPSALVG